MRFFAILKGAADAVMSRVRLLQAACQARTISYIDLDSESVDYSALPQPEDGDIVYNLSRGSQVLETLLLRDKVATCYSVPPIAITNLSNTTTIWSLVHEKCGISVPRAIASITKDRKLLNKYVEQIGGFPLILKASGGTYGVGVIKVESAESLYSAIDFVIGTADHFMLREFVDGVTGRIMVIGGEAVAQVEYLNPPGDFRSNGVYEVKAKKREYPDAVKSSAIQAVTSCGFECGAVDIIVDKAGNHYVLEVNLPFGIAITQEASGVDIAGLLVDYLSRKAARLV